MENYLFYLFAFLLSTVNKTSPIEINITTNTTAEPNTGIILIKYNIEVKQLHIQIRILQQMQTLKILQFLIYIEEQIKQTL